MNINVSNKREEEIVSKFTDFLLRYSEEVSLLLENDGFEAHEAEFLTEAFNQSNLWSSEDVSEILMDSDNIRGICRLCNEHWQGVEGTSRLTINEYETYLNEEFLYDSKCSSCIEEATCNNCGGEFESKEDLKVLGLDKLCDICESEFMKEDVDNE